MIRLLLLLTLSASMQAQPGFLFVPGSTSFASSHASTLVELRDGALLAAWFGGTAEGAADVAIWSARQVSPAAWTAPAELVREPGVPCWNPVLFHAAGGRLWLYYKFGPSVTNWTAARMYSDNEGKSWSTPEHLPAGLLGPIRAKPLILGDGTLVSGSSVESYHAWAVWIERSADDGKTWTKIGPIVPSVTAVRGARAAQTAPDVSGSTDWQFIEGGIIQPSVVNLGGGHLRLYARSTGRAPYIAVADSVDAGLTWSQAHFIDLPNPNSGLDAVSLHDGRVVLIYNDTPAGRTPLNLAISSDGEHFHPLRTLEAQPGEYSYPALIVRSNGDLEMTYTWNRKTIRHVHLALSEIGKAAR